MSVHSVPREHTDAPPPSLTEASRIALTAGMYALVAASLATAAASAAHVGALWPASGFMLGVLLLTAPDRRRSAALALALAHAAAGVAVTRTLIAPVLFAAVVIFQAAAPLALLPRFNLSAPRFNRLADIAWLCLAGVLAAGCLGALAAAQVAHWLLGAPVVASARDWWLREGTGMLVVTPLIVAGVSVRSWRAIGVGKIAESLLLVASLTSVAAYVFLAGSPHLPLSVGVLPFFIWAALRFGVLGVSAASAIFWEVALLATRQGFGPFLSLADTPAGRVAWAHAWVAVTGGFLLVVAAVLAEREDVGRRFARTIDELNDAYARTQAIIASAPDMMGAVDAHCRVIAFNESWRSEVQRRTGTQPQFGMRLDELLAAQRTPFGRAALEGWQRAIRGEAFSVRRGPEVLGDDREMLVDFSPIRDARGAVVGAVQIARDITDERRRQAAEAQSRRLETVGQLAGGIAHDFNNIMTGILSYSTLLEQSLPEGDARVEDVREIERAAERAAGLTSQLLAYARRRVVEPRVIDANARIEDADRLLRPVLGEGVTVHLELAVGAWPVRVDPASFEQVLVELAINARDAMPSGGLLRIGTANATLGADELPQPASGPGDYLRIFVSDTGEGIPPEVADRIFEPFFTTKEVGKGTGLGLASVFGIVQQSGGAIGVATAVGQGTTFNIYLPRVIET